MNIVLVHGSFQSAVLKKIGEVKSNFDPLAVTEISDAGSGFSYSSPSLFSEKRLIILENPDLKTVEKGIEEKSPELTVLIKFSKYLEKSSAILKRLVEVKTEIFVFEESDQTSVFPFLDMLGNLNKKAMVEFERNYLEFGGQYILTMLAYFLRRMVQRPKTGSDFMRQKIEFQKINFSLDKITQLYRVILDTDFRIKQGLIEEKLGVTLLVQKILSAD